MEESLINDLRCPECEGKFAISDKKKDKIGLIISAILSCKSCKRNYPVINYIPRFVPKENYAQNFGFEWKNHAKLQIDKFTGMNFSKERFYRQTKWKKENLIGKKFLEAGCGGGRFSQVAVDDAKLKTYSFDYSVAVDANQENNGIKKGFNLSQADICKIPFEKNSFDYVFCFGVLQHTPNPENSFKSLAKYVKKGGKIAIDVYPRTLRCILHPRYFLRPLTRRMNYDKLYSFIKNYWVPLLLPLSDLVIRIPLFGRTLKNLIPVDNVLLDFNTKLSYKFRREWAVLNTFDWFSPRYDNPQTVKTVRRWFKEAGLSNINVYLDRNIIIGTADYL